MRRIVIVGSAGSGKSRLARVLGETLDVPVIHGDKIFWRPGWRDPDNDEFRADVRAYVDKEAWIYDGNLGRVPDIVLPKADTIIWLEQPTIVCLIRAYSRTLQNLGRTRPDVADGCPEKLSFALWGYIRNFNSRLKPRIEAWVSEYAPEIQVLRLRGDRDVSDFVQSRRRGAESRRRVDG
jgi:adenylate kinase family enzyme